jgi:hypothetical protein
MGLLVRNCTKPASTPTSPTFYDRTSWVLNLAVFQRQMAVLTIAPFTHGLFEFGFGGINHVGPRLGTSRAPTWWQCFRV